MQNTYNARIAALAMPDRIKRLPITASGFPVPWFAHWQDGVPDLRAIGKDKLVTAVRQKLCWVCGQMLGRNLAFTLGPMCAINRTISEPPSHRDCAIYSALACPFLSNPRMRRNSQDLPDHVAAPGNGLLRNPGAVCVWVTRGFRPFKAPGGVLFTFDDPIETLWFAESRTATREEVTASISSGMPLLMAEAEREGARAIAALHRMADAAEQYLPAAIAA